MDSKSMTRKEFVTLTFTLIGGAATAAACSSSSSGGTGGTNGAGGAVGAGGSVGAGGTSGSACTDPLPESQVPDSTGHTHTVTIPASDLNATTDQTITTSEPMPSSIAAHTHMVTLTVANLGTIKGGGSVMVTSTNVMAHMHTYMVSCGAAGGSGGTNGAAGSHGTGGSAAAGSNGAAGNTGAAGH